MTHQIGIASDHAGVELKSSILEHYSGCGDVIIDFGPSTDSAVDYPDYAQKVTQALLRGDVERGILICGTGIGMSMAANKFKGVRAAVVTSPETARLTRQHNDANVLCLSSRFVDEQTNFAIIDTFLETEFAGGRHQDRVEKIDRAV